MTDYEIRLGTSLNDDEEKPVKSSGPVLGSAQSEAEADSERSSGETVEEPPQAYQAEKEQFVAEEPPQAYQAEKEQFVAEEPPQEAWVEAQPAAAEEQPEPEKPKKKERSSTAGSAAKGMLSFFTILPVDADNSDIDAMNQNFWLTPMLIGVFYGILAVISFYIFQWLFGFNLGILLTMAVLIVMNRMLHLDGLMDTADGLTVAGTQEDHVRALKDTHVGAGAIVAVILILIATLFAYMTFGFLGAIVALLVGEVTAKTTQVAAAAFGEPGNGMAGDSVRNTDKDKFILSYLISVAICVIWAVIVIGIVITVNDSVWSKFDTYFVISAALAAIVAPLWGVAMAKLANKNFGYVNGDVLGASNETGRLAVLLMFAMFLNLLFRI
ncbi:MAG: adenosylcobinamide-GDP ribazoletransferase [Candidatus Methanomethylophilaceae archaeon]|jgi:adenosylcobinamide-GDP ribazoletransferase